MFLKEKEKNPRSLSPVHNKLKLSIASVLLVSLRHEWDSLIQSCTVLYMGIGTLEHIHKHVYPDVFISTKNYKESYIILSIKVHIFYSYCSI